MESEAILTPKVVDNVSTAALVPIMPHCAVMLVLDTSHSMYRGTALADLHRSLGVFLGTFGKNTFRGAAVDVAAVGMGDDLRVLDEFRPFGQSRLARLRIRPKGDSPLGGALRLALDRLDQQEEAYRAMGVATVTPQIVILSDGISTDDCMGEVAEIQRRVAARQLCACAIALGPSADRSALAALAGVNVFDPLGADMPGAFAAVGSDLSQRYTQAAADSFQRIASAAGVSGGYFRDHVFCIDGTNMLYWNGGDRLQFDLVLSFARALKAHGADYRVFFDASTPYRLRGKGMPGDEQRYEEMLRQRPDRFVQVPAGTEADAFILMKAEGDPRSVVVSQDLFRDRAHIHPWINDRERHLTGMVIDGELLFPSIGFRIPVMGCGGRTLPPDDLHDG